MKMYVRASSEDKNHYWLGKSVVIDSGRYKGTWYVVKCEYPYINLSKNPNDTLNYMRICARPLKGLIAEYDDTSLFKDIQKQLGNYFRDY